LVGKLNGEYHLGDEGVGERKMLNWILDRKVLNAWTVLSWFTRLSWSRWQMFRFKKKKEGVSWPAEYKMFKRTQMRIFWP